MQLTMVLGYLASGKTTFVENVLRQYKGQKNAVIVNDFGTRDVDGVILGDSSEMLDKIYGGSIFCSCKSDAFVSSMLSMIQKHPDRLIIEASGLANPYTMLREFDLLEKKTGVTFKTNIFCLVDTLHFESIASVCHAIPVQIATSDVILLNKTDLATKETVERVEKLIGTMTKAKIVRTVGAKLPVYEGYPVPEKKLPMLIEDLRTQKATLRVFPTDKESLDKICAAISSVCHRIKGVVTLDGKNYIYQYADGMGTVKETDKEGSFLVTLSCLPRSLKKDLAEIVGTCDFLEIEHD